MWVTSHAVRAELSRTVHSTTNLRWNYRRHLFTSSGGWIAVTDDLWKVWSLQIMTSCPALLPAGFSLPYSPSLSPTHFPLLFLSLISLSISLIVFYFLLGLDKEWKERSTQHQEKMANSRRGGGSGEMNISYSRDLWHCPRAIYP